MLINESYFDGVLEIAQLGQPSVVTKLRSLIAQYEPLILEAALGYDFYQAFLAGLVPGSDEPIEQRWKDLRDGVSFTNVGETGRRFVGLANNSTKMSPLAGFIYYEFMRDLSSQNTGIGLVKNKGENSVKADVIRKPINAFNTAAYQMRPLWEFLQLEEGRGTKIYPEFRSLNVFPYQYGLNFGWIGSWPYSSGELYSFKTKNPYGI